MKRDHWYNSSLPFFLFLFFLTFSSSFFLFFSLPFHTFFPQLEEHHEGFIESSTFVCLAFFGLLLPSWLYQKKNPIFHSPKSIIKCLCNLFSFPLLVKISFLMNCLLSLSLSLSLLFLIINQSIMIIMVMTITMMMRFLREYSAWPRLSNTVRCLQRFFWRPLMPQGVHALWTPRRIAHILLSIHLGMAFLATHLLLKTFLPPENSR